MELESTTDQQLPTCDFPETETTKTPLFETARKLDLKQKSEGILYYRKLLTNWIETERITSNPKEFTNSKDFKNAPYPAFQCIRVQNDLTLSQVLWEAISSLNKEGESQGMCIRDVVLQTKEETVLLYLNKRVTMQESND